MTENIDPKIQIDPANNNRKRNYIIIAIAFLLVCIIGIFVIVNYSAIYKKISFSSSKNDAKIFESTLFDGKQADLALDKKQNLLFLSSAFSYPAPPTPTITNTSASPEPSETSTNNTSQDNNNAPANIVISSGILNNQLIIPSINTRVPIIWDSPIDEASMLANLKNGVVQYAGTAKPDESVKNNSGNVFIVGHSSYYSWDDGRYNSVFANLDSVQINDQFAIGYNDKVYVYKVFDKIVINPSDVQVVSQQTDKAMASLMTCVPVGTNLQRLIVKGEFIGYAQ